MTFQHSHIITEIVYNSWFPYHDSIGLTTVSSAYNCCEVKCVTGIFEMS